MCPKIFFFICLLSVLIFAQKMFPPDKTTREPVDGHITHIAYVNNQIYAGCSIFGENPGGYIFILDKSLDTIKKIDSLGFLTNVVADTLGNIYVSYLGSNNNKPKLSILSNDSLYKTFDIPELVKVIILSDQRVCLCTSTGLQILDPATGATTDLALGKSVNDAVFNPTTGALWAITFDNAYALTAGVWTTYANNVDPLKQFYWYEANGDEKYRRNLSVCYDNGKTYVFGLFLAISNDGSNWTKAWPDSSEALIRAAYFQRPGEVWSSSQKDIAHYDMNTGSKTVYGNEVNGFTRNCFVAVGVGQNGNTMYFGGKKLILAVDYTPTSIKHDNFFVKKTTWQNTKNIIVFNVRGQKIMTTNHPNMSVLSKSLPAGTYYLKAGDMTRIINVCK